MDNSLSHILSFDQAETYLEHARRVYKGEKYLLEVASNDTRRKCYYSC